MNISPIKDYSPLLQISIYATIWLMSSSTYIIGSANATGGVAKFAPGNASKAPPLVSSTTAHPSSVILVGGIQETELSPVLKGLLGNLKREGRERGRLPLPFRGRQRHRRQATESCKKEPIYLKKCYCYYKRNQTYPPEVLKEYNCSQFVTTTTTPPPPTTTERPTTTPTPTYGNFTCFVCDNGIQKNERCQEGSKHSDWEMATSQRCDTVDEFFSAYETIKYEFNRRFPHADKRDTVVSDDDGRTHHPTIHLCVSIAIHPTRKGVELKVVRGCIYGHNADIENGFRSRLTVSPNLEDLADGGIMNAMPTCKTTDLMGPKGMRKVQICVCNHAQKCNHNPIAGAGLAGPFRQLLLLLLSIFVISLSTVIQI